MSTAGEFSAQRGFRSSGTRLVDSLLSAYGVVGAFVSFATLEDVPWSSWVPKQTATLMWIVDGQRVLLIRKKRGLGAGKINAPGGRLDPGETPAKCAIRETQEELHVTPVAPIELGTLAFQFVDGLSLFVHVFRSEAYTGTPTETDEAIPLWFDIDALPYDEMWADDRLWVPLLLAQKPFRGRFLFDDDIMKGHYLESLSE